MYTFQDLCIGDLFNTMSARWVKVSETKAICVMSAVHPLGAVMYISPEFEIVLLWSSVLVPK